MKGKNYLHHFIYERKSIKSSINVTDWHGGIKQNKVQLTFQIILHDIFNLWLVSRYSHEKVKGFTSYKIQLDMVTAPLEPT